MLWLVSTDSQNDFQTASGTLSPPDDQESSSSNVFGASVDDAYLKTIPSEDLNLDEDPTIQPDSSPELRDTLRERRESDFVNASTEMPSSTSDSIASLLGISNANEGSNEGQQEADIDEDQQDAEEPCRRSTARW